MATALVGDTADLLPHQLPSNRGRYSLARALRAMCDPRARRVGGLEGEVSAELERRHSRDVPTPEGGVALHVPWDAESRDLTTVTGAGGIPTIVARPVIDSLRARLVTGRLGAQVMPDLRGSGTLAIPKRTATVTLTYPTESAAPTNTAQGLGQQAVIKPVTLGAVSNVTRQVWVQMPDAEQLVIGDALQAIAVEVDRSCLNGISDAVKPTLGLLQDPNVTTVAIGANGGAPTHAMLCSLEEAIGTANAEFGPLSFVTSPKGRSKLRQVMVESNTGRPLWRADGTLSIGARAEATGNVPVNLAKGSGSNLTAGVLGDWSQLTIGFWGPATIIVNPYMLASSGVYQITVLTDFGFVARNPQSFSKCVDMTTS